MGIKKYCVVQFLLTAWQIKKRGRLLVRALVRLSWWYVSIWLSGLSVFEISLLNNRQLICIIKMKASLLFYSYWVIVESHLAGCIALLWKKNVKTFCMRQALLLLILPCPVSYIICDMGPLACIIVSLTAVSTSVAQSLLSAERQMFSLSLLHMFLFKLMCVVNEPRK